MKSYTQIAVSPEDDIELRRLPDHKPFTRSRELDITSYAEIVLAQPQPTRASRVFQSFYSDGNRPRAPDDSLTERLAQR